MHYTLPVYYKTQVLSEMASNGCDKFTFVSYTPESSTVISGRLHKELWENVWSMVQETYDKEVVPLPLQKQKGIDVVYGGLKAFMHASATVNRRSRIGMHTIH